MKKNLSCFLFLIFILVSCEYAEEDGIYSGGYYLETLDGVPTGGFPVDTDNSGENYNEIVENPFMKVSEEPVSTFSIDADGASFSNVRRFIDYGQKPPLGSIRTEELVNYFTYNYADPSGDESVAVNGEVSSCPWNENHKLIRIGIKGKSVSQQEMPKANFVLLIDVSGSMGGEDKLPLLRKGFINFAEQMRPEDRIAIVTYSGNAGVALPSTPGSQKSKITQAIGKLGAGGSTAGAQGIITAYEIAAQNFIEGGNNRVILGTDGDFNVGISSQEELINLIEQKRDQGIFLTVVGYGTGNLQEGMMEQIANHGNGNFEYIDKLEQSDKVFIKEYSKFLTVAKDVKVQVKFNAAQVEAYRLIGYENRLLEEEDFEDDKKDAGEIGAGQTITALYEIIPAQKVNYRLANYFTIQFRYKQPDQNESRLLELEVANQGKSFAQASEDMRFAAATAGFGLLLRDSDYKGNLNYGQVKEWAINAMNFNPNGYKNELIKLIDKGKNLK